MKIRKALSNFYIDGSIFKYLPLYGTATPQQMGVAYVLQHSGEKEGTSLLDYYVDENSVLTEAGTRTVANIINTMFKDSWDKKYNALISDYQPLENYHMIENENGDDKTIYGEKIKSMEYGAQNRTESHGSRGGSSTKGEQENEEENKISAFNSGSYANDSKRNSSEGQRIDGYEDNAYEDEVTTIPYNDRIIEHADEDDKEFSRYLERRGNIGVTTSQQMLESELNLRAYRFFEKMFDDIDSVIALKVYGEKEFYTYGGGTGTGETVSIQQLADGIRINVLSGGSVIQSVDVKNGVTPKLKVENGALYGDREG